MSDERLRDLLRGLPRHRASANFDERVLERLDAPPPRTGFGRPMARLALAAAAMIVAATVIGFVGRGVAPSPHGRPADGPQVASSAQSGEAVRVQELRRQHDELMRELEALREQSRTASPLLYLGGTDQLDVVVDIGRLGSRSRSDDAPLAQPASQQTRP
jgi:hypothetical protein